MEVFRPAVEAQLKIVSWGKEAVTRTRLSRINSRFSDVIRFTGPSYGSISEDESRGHLTVASTSDNDKAFTNVIYWLPTPLQENPRKFTVSAERNAYDDGYSLIQASLTEYDEQFGQVASDYNPGALSSQGNLGYSEVMEFLKSARALAKTEAQQRHALTFYD